MNNVDLSREALKKNSWTLTELDGLTLHMSPLLAAQSGFVHAFTTRLGGESKAPLDSFNLGRHVDGQDAREDAMRNRERLCQALGISFKRLAVPAQVHSSIVVPASQPTYAEVDGIATNDDTPILLHFADCVPVMILDRKQRLLSVVHAGWRGTAGSIARNGVEYMVKNFGGRAEDMVAAVGPAIGSCCYETGAEVKEALSKTVSRASDLIIMRNGKAYPDLKAINAMQLLEAGVGSVDVTDLCTACQPQIFYSHRQSGGKTGRQGAIASLVNL